MIISTGVADVDNTIASAPHWRPDNYEDNSPDFEKSLEKAW